jgi:hypothetical protein
LRSNLKDAFKQLRKRYKDNPDPKVRGIAAISISKMENDGSRLLRARSRSELDATILRLSQRFETRLSDLGCDACDHRTVAVLASLRAPSRIEDINLFTVVRQFI